MSARQGVEACSQSQVNWQQIKQLYLVSKCTPVAPQPDISSAYAELIERKVLLEIEAMIRPTLLEIEAVHVKQMERIEEQYTVWLQALQQRIMELEKVMNRIVVRQQLIKRQLRHQQWQNDQLLMTPLRKSEKSTNRKSFIHIEDAAEDESLLEDIEEPSKVEPAPITITERDEDERLYPSEVEPRQDRHFLSANHSDISLSRYTGHQSHHKLTRLQTKESNLELSRSRHRMTINHTVSEYIEPTGPANLDYSFTNYRNIPPALSEFSPSRQSDRGQQTEANHLLQIYRDRLKTTENELSEIRDLLMQVISEQN